MSIVITKGNSFSGQYTQAVIATANDWTGVAGVYSSYPGTAIATVPITQAGDVLSFVLPIDTVNSLAAGTYIIVSRITSVRLGIDTYRSDTVIVSDVKIYGGSMTTITLTLGKLDGTPVGEETKVLRSFMSDPETTYVTQEVTTQIPDPDNPPLYSATGGIEVISAPVTFTIPTKSFSTSSEAWQYANAFLYLATGLNWGTQPTSDVSVVYSNGSYVVSGTKTLPEIGRWSSTVWNGAGGSTVDMILGFSSSAECSAYIESMMSNPSIDRTSAFSYSFGPYAYGGGTITETSMQSVPLSSVPISKLDLVSKWKGVTVQARVATAFNVGSKIIGTDKLITETDDFGYAEFQVVKGSTVTVSCPSFGKSITVDTTGLDTIDLSTYF